MTTSIVPTSAVLAGSAISNSDLLLLHDAMQSVTTTGRWSQAAVANLLADLETACNLRGIQIAAGTKTETVVKTLLY